MLNCALGLRDVQTWLTGMAYLSIIVSLYSYSLFLCVNNNNSESPPLISLMYVTDLQSLPALGIRVDRLSCTQARTLFSDPKSKTLTYICYSVQSRHTFLLLF